MLEKNRPAAQRHSRPQGGGVDEGLFDADLVASSSFSHGQRDLSVELVVDVGRERELAFASEKPCGPGLLRPRAGTPART
jgi:hypothetical protein